MLLLVDMPESVRLRRPDGPIHKSRYSRIPYYNGPKRYFQYVF